MYFEISEEGKILACAEEQVYSSLIKLEVPPEFNIDEMSQWKVINGEFIYDPIEIKTTPTAFDILEAQVVYTAMMTDTLLEV